MHRVLIMVEKQINKDSRKFGSWGSEIQDPGHDLIKSPASRKNTQSTSRFKRQLLKYYIILRNKINGWLPFL
ncbi:MAG TPA: hypothetical protein PLZ32_16110 [Saprospiraceae bacterium]|nr:hypothetical protein [Saprospiraceae bacterium]